MVCVYLAFLSPTVGFKDSKQLTVDTINVLCIHNTRECLLYSAALVQKRHTCIIINGNCVFRLWSGGLVRVSNIFAS